MNQKMFSANQLKDIATEVNSKYQNEILGNIMFMLRAAADKGEFKLQLPRQYFKNAGMRNNIISQLVDNGFKCYFMEFSYGAREIDELDKILVIEYR